MKMRNTWSHKLSEECHMFEQFIYLKFILLPFKARFTHWDGNRTFLG